MSFHSAREWLGPKSSGLFTRLPVYLSWRPGGWEALTQCKEAPKSTRVHEAIGIVVAVGVPPSRTPFEMSWDVTAHVARKLFLGTVRHRFCRHTTTATSDHPGRVLRC